MRNCRPARKYHCQILPAAEQSRLAHSLCTERRIHPLRHWDFAYECERKTPDSGDDLRKLKFPPDKLCRFGLPVLPARYRRPVLPTSAD